MCNKNSLIALLLPSTQASLDAAKQRTEKISHESLQQPWRRFEHEFWLAMLSTGLGPLSFLTRKAEGKRAPDYLATCLGGRKYEHLTLWVGRGWCCAPTHVQTTCPKKLCTIRRPHSVSASNLLQLKATHMLHWYLHSATHTQSMPF